MCLLAIMMFYHSTAQVQVSIRIAPPALPVYTQPYCPDEGYIWIPGYWAYDPDTGYYWVPGEWVLPPEAGYYWTPGYWAFTGDDYLWHAGYWGPEVGFYGGIDYGYGYFGNGYVGGRWQDGRFLYNTSCTRVNVRRVHDTYVNRSVIRETAGRTSRFSFNGRGGTRATPTVRDQEIDRQHHIQPTAAQETRRSEARSNRNQFASVNHGHPQELVRQHPPAGETPPQQQAHNQRVTTPADHQGEAASHPSHMTHTPATNNHVRQQRSNTPNAPANHQQQINSPDRHATGHQPAMRRETPVRPQSNSGKGRPVQRTLPNQRRFQQPSTRPVVPVQPHNGRPDQQHPASMTPGHYPVPPAVHAHDGGKEKDQRH